MTDLEQELEPTWFTAGHGDLWNCAGTYCGVPYKKLPEAPQLDDRLAWLSKWPRYPYASTLEAQENNIAHLGRIVAEAQRVSFELPQDFLLFLATPSYHAKVPTCTACYLELSEHLVPAPGFDGSYLLRFMNDSQCCVLWYLLLQPKCPARVVASTYILEREMFELSRGDDSLSYEEVFLRTRLCAYSFTEFLYRFHIENSIWFATYKSRPLLPAEADYKRAAQASWK